MGWGGQCFSKPELVQDVQFLDAQEPVSVEFMRVQCRIDSNAEDLLLSTYIAAARKSCELELMSKVRRQRVKLFYSGFFSGLLLSGVGHSAELVEVAYKDADGARQVLDSSLFEIEPCLFPVLVVKNGAQLPTSWSCSAVEVTVDAGYLSAIDVPEGVRMWIALQAASMFKAREAHSDKPLARLEFVDGLLDPYRIPVV